jgi:hypothetical protein
VLGWGVLGLAPHFHFRPHLFWVKHYGINVLEVTTVGNGLQVVLLECLEVSLGALDSVGVKVKVF